MTLSRFLVFLFLGLTYYSTTGAAILSGKTPEPEKTANVREKPRLQSVSTGHHLLNSSNQVSTSGIFNGPVNLPEAIGPTDANDDFTNKSTTLTANASPGSTIDPSAVTFTNTVLNSSGQTANISLVLTAPSTNNLLPTGTVVTISYASSSATYTYSGTVFTFTNGSGVVGGNPIGAVNPVRIDGLATNAVSSYTVTVDLPPGTPLSTDGNIQRGFPVPVTAFIDANANGTPDNNEVANKTIDRVYTGFLQVVKQTRILQGTGPAVQGTDGTLSTTPKQPAPGNIVEYQIAYKNISESAPVSGSGNITISANNVVLTEDGTNAPNNWATDNDTDGALDTQHVLGSTQGASGTFIFFSGNPSTNLLGAEQSGTTAASDVTKYIISLSNAVAPGSTGTFIFQRKVNQTKGGTTIENQAPVKYEDINNANVNINGLSNKVTTTVAEVAGLRVAAGTVVDVNGGTIQAGDQLIFPFTITNTGNDPTRVKLPEQVGISGPASVSLLEYSLTNGISWSAISSGGVTVSSLTVNASVLVRVIVNISQNATPQAVIKVTFGETNPAETADNASRTGSVNDLRDAYTIDNADGTVTGEVPGTPVNGVVEVSTSLSASISPKYYALATLACTRGAYDNKNTVNDITDDQINYGLSLQVRSTDNTGQGITPSALAGVQIPGLSGTNILVSFAIPAGTSLRVAPPAPTGWTVVFTITPVSTAANAATWTTTVPSNLSTVTRVGFAKTTIDGNTSTFLASADAQSTSFSTSLSVRPNQVPPLKIALLGQVFGKTPETNVPVFDESGDPNPGNFDGTPGNMTPPDGTDLNGDGVPDQLPAVVPDGYINDEADLTATGTDTNGNNGGDQNNASANNLGEANVFTISGLSITLSGTVAVCQGQPASFTPVISGGTSPYSLTISDGSATTVLANYTAGQGIVVNPPVSRTYTVVALSDASSNTVTGKGTTIVTVSSSGVVAISGLAYVPDGSTPCRGKLTASVSGRQFVVTGPGGYVFSSVYRSTVSGIPLLAPEIRVAGTYTLTATDLSGCTTSVTESITVKDLCTKP